MLLLRWKRIVNIMKVLIVEQLGKNNWEYVYSAAKYMAIDNDITCYMSDTTPDIKEKHDFKIVYGFHGAYAGNVINKVFNYIKSLVQLKKYIKDNKFDIVHFEWFSLPWVEWLYIRQLKHLSKIVITVNDVIPFNKRPLEMRCLQWIYSAADSILLHTEDTLNLFNTIFKTSCAKYVITPAFRDKANYKKIDKLQARRHLGIPDDKDVVLYFGTVRQSKGLDLLIKAFPKALQVNPNLFLLGAGAFHAVNEEYYIKLVNDNLNDDCGKFNFMHVSDDELQYYFSAADILCVPYREIYQSGIAQFGLIFELPIIGSNLKRMSDMIKAGVNGEVFECENIEDLATKLSMLSLDKEKILMYCEGSKNISLKNFSVAERAKRTLEAYSALVGEI